MSIEIPSPGNSVMMQTDWNGYLEVLQFVGDNSHLRVTYDRGRLEIMSPSEEHEQVKEFLGRLVETVMEETDCEFRPGGSMTFRREDLERGLEPDKCYWIENWEAVLGKGQYVPETDPPPDLAVEVEVTRSMLNRQSIYEALRVPEIWRWTAGGRLCFLCLTNVGYHEVLSLDRRAYAYVERERSAHFPTLDPKEVEGQVTRAFGIGTLRWIRELREWLRS